MGGSPTRNHRASRSLGPETCCAETLSSGFQVLPCRSRQEDEGKLSCSRPLEEEGVGPWQEEEARPSHEADSPTPSLVRLAASFVHLRMAEEARLKDYHGQRTLLCRFLQWLKGKCPFFQPPLDFI